ncbi:glycosyltransferase [Mucilaginibacter sp. AW1-3]
MSEIKISVILPNYNSEKYLQQCIDSFVEQKYDNKELIIVDAKSTDSSHRIIQDFADKYPNVIWVKEPDTCVTDGFNIGLKYVSGDFIGFMSSDSIYYTDDIFASINSSYKKIKFDCVYFNAYSYYTQDDRKSITLRNCNYEFTRDTFLKQMCFVPFENILFHKDIFSKYKLDPSYNLASDIEFYLRILENRLLGFFIDKVSTVNIYDGENLSMAFPQKQWDQWLMVDIKPLFESEIIPESEFQIHKQLIQGTFTVSKQYVKDIEAWLLKLIEANQRAGFYNDGVFKDKYAPYWYDLLLKSRRYGLWTYFKFTRSPLSKKVLQLPVKKKVKLLYQCTIGFFKGN